MRHGHDRHRLARAPRALMLAAGLLLGAAPLHAQEAADPASPGAAAPPAADSARSAPALASPSAAPAASPSPGASPLPGTARLLSSKKVRLVGKTDKHAGSVVERPVSPKDVLATVYHLLGIDPHTTLTDRTGKPVPLVADGEVVAEMLA